MSNHVVYVLNRLWLGKNYPSSCKRLFMLLRCFIIIVLFTSCSSPNCVLVRGREGHVQSMSAMRYGQSLAGFDNYSNAGLKSKINYIFLDIFEYYYRTRYQGFVGSRSEELVMPLVGGILLRHVDNVNCLNPFDCNLSSSGWEIKIVGIDKEEYARVLPDFLKFINGTEDVCYEIANGPMSEIEAKWYFYNASNYLASLNRSGADDGMLVQRLAYHMFVIYLESRDAGGAAFEYFGSVCHQLRDVLGKKGVCLGSFKNPFGIKGDGTYELSIPTNIRFESPSQYNSCVEDFLRFIDKPLPPATLIESVSGEN